MEGYFEKYQTYYLNFLFNVECYKLGKSPESVIEQLKKTKNVTSKSDEDLIQKQLEEGRKRPAEILRLEVEKEEKSKLKEGELHRLEMERQEAAELARIKVEEAAELARIKVEEEIEKNKYDISFADGYYLGETQIGLMHGKGVRYWNTGKKWEGNWGNGKANGHIVVTIDNEIVYEGNMIDDLPNGKGKYINPDTGETYIGDWVNFRREGEGSLHNDNGDKIYDGEWKNDKYHGYGQYFLRGVCRFDGNWENGKKNGEGIAYDENGNEEYNGQWKDNERLDEPDRIEQAANSNIN